MLSIPHLAHHLFSSSLTLPGVRVIPLKNYNVFLTKIYPTTSAWQNQNGNQPPPPYGA
jgi:hypothetical protein